MNGYRPLIDSLKVDLMRYKNHLIHMTQSMPIDIEYNTEVTSEYVANKQPDAIIIATGSTPITPRIPGIDLPSVKHATTVYTDLSIIGDSVVVIGGGLVGCETGLFLAELGKAVTIVEMQDEIAPEANWMHKEGMCSKLVPVAVAFLRLVYPWILSRFIDFQTVGSLTIQPNSRYSLSLIWRYPIIGWWEWMSRT